MIKGYTDLGDKTENQRIFQIGHACMAAAGKNKLKPFIAGVIVETQEKAERYKAKMAERFPKVVFHGISKGPVPDTVLIRFGEPAAPEVKS